MNEFDSNNDRNEKIEFIKRLGIIVFVFIIIFLVVRGCNNYLTDQIRDDINKDKIAKIEKEQSKSEEIDLSKPFGYYNITNDSELRKVLFELKKEIKPYQLQEYIDLNEYSITHNWNKYNSIYEYLNVLLDIAYRSFLRKLIDNKVNYDEAPLTEHFKGKFKDGLLIEYANLDINNSLSWIKYDFKNRYFALQSNIGEAVDYYYFNFILDEEGYLDDVVFDRIEHVLDEFGEKIPELDKYLMNDEKVVKEIIKWMCTPVEYGRKTAPVDDWYHAYDEDLEYGLTDRFREYAKEVWNIEDWDNNTGILPYVDYENFNIESIDMDNKIAVIKVELEDKYVYYNISWTTDENYRMDTIEARFNREELK